VETKKVDVSTEKLYKPIEEFAWQDASFEDIEKIPGYKELINSTEPNDDVTVRIGTHKEISIEKLEQKTK
jgi:hypothetical protein